MSIISNKRIEYIDALRGFTMFLVVYQHISTWGGVYPYDSALGEILTAFRMPLFFFISGYVAYKSMDWNRREYTRIIVKKTKVQLIPTVIFSIILGAAVYGMFTYYLPIYWFTLVLFEMFVIFYTVSLICRKNEIIKFGVLIALSISGVIFIATHSFTNFRYYELFCFENLFKYFQFFTLGLIAKRFDGIYQKVLESTLLNTLAILTFVASVITIRNFNIMETAPFAGSLLRSIVSRYAGLFIVLSLFFRHRDYFAKNGRISKTMQYVGRHTLDIYMLHYFLLSYNNRLVACILGCNSIPVEICGIGLMAAIIIAICLCLSEILRNSSFLAQYLFGAKKRSDIRG